MDATVVPSPGRRIEDATVLVRDGRIVAVGRGVSVPDDAEVISARGGFVYAGFIDAGNSKLLSSESAPKPIVGRPMDFSSDVLAATRPDNRKGLTPQFCAAEVLQLDPKKLEALRQSGITTVHLVPAGRIASGQSAVVTTSGVPLREAVLQPNLFGQFQLYAPGGRTYPATLMGATAHLRQLFLDARRYRRHAELFREKPNQIPRPPFDPTLLALQRILDGSQRPLFLANSRDEIHRALDFAREQRLKIALWGASEAAECISRLRRERPGLIVQVDFGDPPKIEDSLPGTKPTPGTKPSELTPEVKPPLRAQRDKQDRWKHRVGSLAELNKAGLRFAVSSRKLDHPADILKNLRTAIEHGLPRDAALAALTTNAAKLLGLSDRLGTIEPGKLAHLVVLTAPFDDKQAKVRFVFVDGLKFEYNKQKEAVREAASPRRPDKAASVDVSGRWQMEIQSGKAPFPAELTLLPEGPRLSGTFSSTQGDGRVTEGRVSGDRITFTVAIGAGDRAIHLKFSGTCQKTTMSGTVSSPFGRAAPWKAIRREEPNEPDNPIQLALEPVVVETPAAAPKKSSASPSGKAPAGPETASKKKADELPAGAWPTELEKDRRAARRGNGNLFVRGGTIWTGTGQTLRNASILIEKGKIKAIGQGLTPPKGTLVVDARGRFILPGLIDTHSHIMIAGGTNENTQSIVAEVRVRDAIQTDDVSEYRALAGGVTTVRLLHGSANVIGGQHAVVKLRYGATAREHLVPNAPQGVKFALGENPKGRPKRFPRSRPGVEATLRRAFAEAARYQEQWRQFRQAVKRDKNLLPPRRDLRLEALADILSHKKFMDCHCYRADEILMVFRVAESFGFRVNSLQHALEAYKVAPEVAAHGASCSTFSDWWAYKVEAYDATPYNVALLTRAGVNAVLKSDNAELMRHLYQEAAKMLRYGDLPADQALQTITLNAARELKLEGRIGTIEVGKDGDLAIFNGHPLNAFARCEMTIIEGVVYFERQKQPSAMSAAATRRSARPPRFALAPRSMRRRRLDLSREPSGRYAIVRATIHPIDKPEIPNGTVLIEKGRIAAVGRKVSLPEDAKIIEADGLHVFPGLIDAGTTLGLTEIDKVAETIDYADSGLFRPDLRAGVAVNPDSALIPVARAGGVTTVLIVPKIGIISGQASLVSLAGWTAPDMTLQLEAGLAIQWPGGKSAKERVEQLRQFVHRARLYDRARSVKKPSVSLDPRLEAMRPYLRGERPVLVEATSRKQIAEALLFAEKEKLRLVLVGAADAWKLAPELKKRKVPVILGPVMRDPVAEYDPFDASYANAGRLYEAGVRFCFRSDSATNSRNVPFEAAMAVAYGLPQRDALRALTLSAAEILGVADQLGSITPGKQATLIVTDGSPLQPSTQIKAVFIRGQPFAPRSRHTKLFRRYLRRLNELRHAKPARRRHSGTRGNA